MSNTEVSYTKQELSMSNTEVSYTKHDFSVKHTDVSYKTGLAYEQHRGVI